MKVIQCLLLAFVTAFLAAVNADDLELVPFYEAMSEGDIVLLAQNGPFNFTTACDSSAVTLNVYFEATQEHYVLTDMDSPANFMAGDTASYLGVFHETSYGNDYANGGFVSASGYYVGWNGQSVIGLHTTDSTTEGLFGDNISCVIAGVVMLIQQS